MRLGVLASGSRGNALTVEHEGKMIFITTNHPENHSKANNARATNQTDTLQHQMLFGSPHNAPFIRNDFLLNTVTYVLRIKE